jgi:hypothetical protein
MSEIEHSDRAATHLSYEVADGEYNRKVEIRATQEGLEIDYFTLSWDWILRAFSSVSPVSPAPTRLQKGP